MRIVSLAGRRLAASIPTLFLILIGVFLLLQLAPGDTVDALMAQMGGGDAATARELRKFYGLDLSIPVQLGNYLWRLVLLDLRQAGGLGDPGAAAADDSADDGVAVLCVLLWPPVRRDRRARRQPLAGYADLDARADLLRDAVVLVRIDGDRGVLGLSAMAAAGRLRGYRHGAERDLARGRYRKASRAADADARADLSRDLPAHHARLDAGSAQSRFRPHRARQGLGRNPRGDAPRAAQRATTDGDADRAAGRHHAGRLGRGRKRVLAAGARAARLRIRGAARPQYLARDRVRLGAARHNSQLHRRPALCAARSADRGGGLTWMR